MKRRTMNLKEIEVHFGEVEYRNLKRGWVKITNDFESKHMVTAKLPFVKPRYLHKKILPALRKALELIEKKCPYDSRYEYIEVLQIFAPRHIGNNRARRLSCHTWGIAFDINPVDNMPGDSDYTIPSYIVDIFESVGFTWGGRFSSKDYMHFEPSRTFFDFTSKW